VVISPFHFFDVIEEYLFRDAMMFHQTLFSKGRESFNPIDVDLSLYELVLMVDIEMPVSVEHERIKPAPFVGIND